ncbi:hypothetical protein ACHAWF_009205 [Thalassiosira exigua]
MSCQNWRQDLWTKWFVRDHQRYTDEIQCAAARVVTAVRKLACDRDSSGNPKGEFDSFHIRRGDFQYQFNNTHVEVDWVHVNSRDDIPENATSELKGVNSNFYGIIDQLVASRGRTFLDDFTRPSLSTSFGADGGQRGKLNRSYYYTGKTEKHLYDHYFPVHTPVLSKEPPTSWRVIDKEINVLLH